MEKEEKQKAMEILMKNNPTFLSSSYAIDYGVNPIIDAMIEFKNTPTVDLTELRKEFGKDFYTEYPHYGSFTDQYVKFLEGKLTHIHPKQDKESDAVDLKFIQTAFSNKKNYNDESVKLMLKEAYMLGRMEEKANSNYPNGIIDTCDIFIKTKFI